MTHSMKHNTNTAPAQVTAIPVHELKTHHVKHTMPENTLDCTFMCNITYLNTAKLRILTLERFIMQPDHKR